jgi:hypothetical protein
MYEGYIKQAVQGELCDQWRSGYTIVAFLGGHYETARKQLELLNWKLSPHSFQGWGTDLSLLPLKVAALTGSSAGEVKRAEESFSLLDLPQATKIYTELAGSTNTDERTRQFSRARLEGLKQETRLAKGEWIEFLPAGEADPNWVIINERLRRLSDGALEVEAGSEGHGFYCRTRVGPDFEITGEVEFVRSSTGDFQAGVFFGLPDSFNSEWYAFRLKRNNNEGQIVSFSRQWSRQQASARVELNDKRNTFRFRLQAGKADAWLNENQVLFQASPAKTLRLYPDCMLGLGAYNDVNQTVLRYRNVKVRRVQAGR